MEKGNSKNRSERLFSDDRFIVIIRIEYQFYRDFHIGCLIPYAAQETGQLTLDGE